MKIEIKNEKLRKPAFDILNIFFPKEDLEFVKAGGELFIGEDFVSLGGKSRGYEDNLSLKEALYMLLSSYTAYKSPWGLMTGSKPSKAYEKYGQDFLRKKYFVSDEKVKLLRAVKNEQDKEAFNREALNLYINIPFCPSRCDYCSYPTILGQGQDRGEYISYLIREIEGLNLPKKLDTIYVGGGTPSFLKLSDMYRLLKTLKERFSRQEFTYEAGRVDTLNFDKLTILKAYGVDRLSLNPQTFTGEILKLSARDLDLLKFRKIYSRAKEMGFIINMDFIVGLYGEKRETFLKNFSYLREFMPDNVTFHALAGKVGSKYFERGTKGYRQEAVLISKDIGKFVEENSYFPYYLYRQKNIISNLENVGYERNHTANRYNIIINEEKEGVVGCGMNANSKFVSGEKYRNPRNLRDYYENFEESLLAKNQILGKSWETGFPKDLTT